MTKFYGAIGYAETVETEPGVWEEKIVERNYYGDLVRNARSLQQSGNVNDNINISNILYFFYSISCKLITSIVVFIVAMTFYLYKLHFMFFS